MPFAGSVAALGALRPDGGEHDADDRHVAVHGDDHCPVEEVRVREDDNELGDVEEDGGNEVGERDVVERPDALRPRA